MRHHGSNTVRGNHEHPFRYFVLFDEFKAFLDVQFLAVRSVCLLLPSIRVGILRAVTVVRIS